MLETLRQRETLKFMRLRRRTNQAPCHDKDNEGGNAGNEEQVEISPENQIEPLVEEKVDEPWAIQVKDQNPEEEHGEEAIRAMEVEDEIQIIVLLMQVQSPMLQSRY